MKHSQPREFSAGDRVVILAGIPIPGVAQTPNVEVAGVVEYVDDPSWPSVIPYRIRTDYVPDWFNGDVPIIWAADRNLRPENQR